MLRAPGAGWQVSGRQKSLLLHFIVPWLESGQRWTRRLSPAVKPRTADASAKPKTIRWQ